MVDLEVIDDPAAAALAVDPIKSQLLAALAEPASAAALAARLGIARRRSTTTCDRSKSTASSASLKSASGGACANA